MRQFSRHLPPLQTAGPPGWKDWAILISLAPLVLPTILLSLAVKVFLAPREKRRLAAFKAVREDTICAFRRGFDCRKVDPWIIRAAYEEVRNWSPGFPVETMDDIETDLQMWGEDIEDLVIDIAERSGYDLTDTAQNPWCERVKTVGDLVLFINHQPKTISA